MRQMMYETMNYTAYFIYTGNMRQGLLRDLGHHSSPLSVIHHLCPPVSLTVDSSAQCQFFNRYAFIYIEFLLSDMPN